MLENVATLMKSTGPLNWLDPKNVPPWDIPQAARFTSRIPNSRITAPMVA